MAMFHLLITPVQLGHFGPLIISPASKIQVGSLLKRGKVARQGQQGQGSRRTGGRQEVCWLLNSGKECRFEKMPGREVLFIPSCMCNVQEPGSSSEQMP